MPRLLGSALLGQGLTKPSSPENGSCLIAGQCSVYIKNRHRNGVTDLVDSVCLGGGHGLPLTAQDRGGDLPPLVSFHIIHIILYRMCGGLPWEGSLQETEFKVR